MGQQHFYITALLCQAKMFITQQRWNCSNGYGRVILPAKANQIKQIKTLLCTNCFYLTSWKPENRQYNKLDFYHNNVRPSSLSVWYFVNVTIEWNNFPMGLYFPQGTLEGSHRNWLWTEAENSFEMKFLVIFKNLFTLLTHD